MEGQGSRRGVFAVLLNWVWWSPVLLLPFSVVFLDTWLSTKAIQRDYRINELTSRMAEVQAQLDDLRVQEAELRAIRRIDHEAPNLGLKQPEPEQIRTIYYTEADTDDLDVVAFLAQGPGSAPVDMMNQGAFGAPEQGNGPCYNPPMAPMSFRAAIAHLLRNIADDLL